MHSIGFLSETFLACGLAVCLSVDEPPPIEYSAPLGEAKAEIRRLKSENKRLKKEVDRLGEVVCSNTGHNDTDSRNNYCGADVDISWDGRNDSVSTILNVEATFYTAFCPTGCIGITATGLDVRNTIYTADGYRIIAVDPSVIPLGSIVKVSLENGDSFTAKAEDTGGAIKGGRIDVLVASKSEARRLGRQSAKVEIKSKGDR